MTLRMKIVYACTAWVSGMLGIAILAFAALVWSQNLAGVILGVLAVSTGVAALTAGASVAAWRWWLGPIVHAVADRTLDVRQAEHEVQRYDKEQTLIAKYAETCTKSQEPTELYRRLTAQMAQAVGAPMCFIMRYEKAANKMVAQAPAFGVTDQVVKSTQYVVTPDIKSVWNFSTQGSLVSNDSLADRRVLRGISSTLGLFNCVVVPFFFQGRVTGLIVAANKPNWFTHDDVRLLTAFAGYTSLAVANQQLQNEVRRSIRDPITTLYTAHHFRTLLEQESGAAGANPQGCSVLAIAVDDFQTCLDLYGRPGANRILKEVGALVTAAVPDAVVARYGAHELAVMLRTTREEALVRAEGIRRAVEAGHVAVETGIPLSVTVSVGVASAVDNHAPESVLYAAQAALRQSRQLGKNSIVTAGADI